MFVTFEVDNLNQPLYFGGASLLASEREYLVNDYVNKGEPYKTNNQDRLTEYSPKQRGLQTIFKSIKGATIQIDDEDGQERITLISADGQVFEMGVKDTAKQPLPRRGNKKGTNNNPNSYMRYTNGTESIEVKDGQIVFTAKDIIFNGNVKNNP